MKFQHFSVAMMLAAGLAVGCEEASNTLDSAQEAAGDAVEATGEAASDLKDASADAVDAMAEKGSEAMESAKDAGAQAVDATKDATADALDAVGDKANEMADGLKADSENALGGLTLDSLKEGMSLDSAQVDGIIEQVKGLIGEGNIETAKSWITKLESMELPEGYADKIASLKTMLGG